MIIFILLWSSSIDFSGVTAKNWKKKKKKKDNGYIMHYNSRKENNF